MSDLEVQAQDLEIVRLCALDPFDQAAWEKFGVRFAHVIQYRISKVARDASKEDREDLCQAILMKIWTDGILEEYDSARAPVRAFLHSVVVNAVRDAFRRRPREEAVDSAKLDFIATAQRVADRFPAVTQPEIFLILKDLLEKEANTKWLEAYFAYMEGASVEEVMAQCGISQATAYRRSQELLEFAARALGIASRQKSKKKAHS